MTKNQEFVVELTCVEYMYITTTSEDRAGEIALDEMAEDYPQLSFDVNDIDKAR